MAEYTMTTLLHTMVKRDASDLHISANSPPKMRVDGELYSYGDENLTEEMAREFCFDYLTKTQRKVFETCHELDFSFEIPKLSRFRGNVYRKRETFGGAFRCIPHKIRTFDELNLPTALETISSVGAGLVLVTGVTGSGKTTTLAALIDKINTERREHIITIEDPIEFIHPNKLSLISQRELHVDTESFSDALRFALRQDPDVVLLGEMRDLETTTAAITLAETGHLVFATLHTASAIQTVNRIIDVFPAAQQDQIRAQLAFVLRGVVSQKLIPKAGGSGRVLAMEILIPNQAIRSLIRDDKIHQIASQMVAGQKHHGMQTLDQHLFQLCRDGLVDPEKALVYATSPVGLRADLLASRIVSVDTNSAKATKCSQKIAESLSTTTPTLAEPETTKDDATSGLSVKTELKPDDSSDTHHKKILFN